MNARLLIFLCALFFAGGCSYEKVEQEIGHMGAARRDPFLAAQRFMQSRDFPVQTIARFAARPEGHGTVITPAQSFVNHGMAAQALKWVATGGHLVVFLRDGEAFRNDWSPFSLRDWREEDPEIKRLFEQLGVAETKVTEVAAKGTINGRLVEFQSPATFSWRKGEKPRLRFALGDGDEPAAASFDHGSGHVTIIASAKPFRNRHIGDGNNAWAFWLLTAHTETTGLWFLQGARISFFAMLWEHAWMAIVGLLLLIGFWLWRHLPRFGPFRQAPEETHRDFASHLGVIGAFQWRHGQATRLLLPLRETIARAASRRGWPATDEDRLHEHLGAAAGLAPARVQAALRFEPREAQSFLAVVQDLQKIAVALRA